jgi:deoxyribodipyrimidine photolyase-like uncharacterized protein
LALVEREFAEHPGMLDALRLPATREAADWPSVVYIDTYVCAVEPDVLAMETFTLDDLFVTEPYVSAAAHINRM